MKLKPASAGLKVKDPVSGKFIPESGIEVNKLTTYWARRLDCGDVVEVQEKPVPAVAEKSADKKEKPKSGGNQ